MDASFLYAETPNAHMAGAGLAIYDPSTAPGGTVTFDDILQNFRRRLHLSRSFRQKLVRVPFDLDHPYWIEDPNFDLEFHVRQLALPPPGSWRQLCVQTARLLERPLDLTRPLWEFYVIEGLDDIEDVPEGSFAIVSKIHHAAIDGMSGIELMNATHDRSPDEVPPEPDTTWRPDREPTPYEMLSRATVNNVRKPMHFARVVGRTVPAVGRIQRELFRQRGLPSGVPPRTRFSVNVSPHRVVDARRFELAEMRRIKSGLAGATVNDVVLTVVGGGLRQYLSDKGELPDAPLVAMCPISVRSESERAAAGNQVSGMFVPIGTDIADPRARLDAITEATHRSKAFSEALGARTLVDFSEFMPGGLVGFAGRTTARLGTANRTRPIFNTTVTNMPGPQHPLYFSGARMVANYGFGMIVAGMGLIHPVTSYCGAITIGFASDRAMMPDPEVYADCIQQSFEELAKAV
jgi:WS/DGAT/MGAT family acyltransferase